MEDQSTTFRDTMNHLGKYKKYIIAVAVIQSIIVAVAGYVLFKSKIVTDPPDHRGQEKTGVEEPLKRND